MSTKQNLNKKVKRKQHCTFNFTIFFKLNSLVCHVNFHPENPLRAIFTNYR